MCIYTWTLLPRQLCVVPQSLPLKMLYFRVCNSGKNENTCSLRVLLQYKFEITGGGKFQVDKNDINWIKKDNDHFIFVHLHLLLNIPVQEHYFISPQSVQSPFTSLCFLFYVKISHFSLPAEPLIFEMCQVF